MRRWFAFLICIGPLTLASTWTRAGEKAGPNDNTPPPGFHALFNGKDLSGWQGLVMTPDPDNPKKKIPAFLANLPTEEREAKQKKADDEMQKHWKAVDGIITYDGKNNN